MGRQPSIVSADEASQRLPALIKEVEGSHRPVQITGEHGNAILVAESDWNSIQETLHLLQVPGMRDSIREGLESDLNECSEQLDW